MSIDIKGKSFSAKASLLATLLTIVSLIGFIIYGAVYTVYFDWAVILFLIIGGVFSAIYALYDNRFADFAPLFAVIFMTAALGLFFLNSYPVWADWYGGFTMYGSEGGIVPVIVLIVLYLLTIIFDMIACFTPKSKEA